jgi:hypothetical protein
MTWVGGWLGGWGKDIKALNLLQLGKAYNGRMNTQTEALITTPFDRYDVTLYNTSAVNLA